MTNGKSNITMTKEEILQQIIDDLCSSELIEIANRSDDNRAIDANKIKVLLRIDILEGNTFTVMWMTNLHNCYQLCGHIEYQQEGKAFIATDTIDSITLDTLLAFGVTRIDNESAKLLSKQIKIIKNIQPTTNKLTVYGYMTPTYV